MSAAQEPPSLQLPEDADTDTPDSNPHLAVLQAMQRRKSAEQLAMAAAAQEEVDRRARQEENVHLRKIQEDVLQGTVNPHALIIARQAARRAELERQEREAAEEKAQRQAARLLKARGLDETNKSDNASSASSTNEPDRLAPCAGALLVLDDKQKWNERWVELKESSGSSEAPVCTAAISIYEGQAADPVHLSDEISLAGSIILQEFITPTSLTMTLSLRKPKPRPNAFSLFINEKCLSMEANSEAERDRWRDAIRQYIERYHQSSSSTSDNNNASNSRRSSDSTDSKRKSGNVSITSIYNSVRGKHLTPPVVEPPLPAEEVINPLHDEIVNLTFENQLFSE